MKIPFHVFAKEGEAKGFKLPRKLLQQQQEKQRAKENNEASDDDIFDKALEEEISGDRWLASDVVKALRAYQRAYSQYLQCISRNPMHYEARYNISSLLFSIYNNYIKNDGIRFSEFTSCEDALNGQETAVVQNLTYIVNYFETTIEFYNSIDATSNDEIQWTDLFFNAGLCFTEYIEDLSKGNKEDLNYFQMVITYTIKARDLLFKVLERQTDLLISHNSVQEPMTPTIVLETAINIYGLFTASYEAALNKDHYQLVAKEITEYIPKLDYVIQSLVEEYFNKVEKPVQQEEQDELYLSQSNIDKLNITKVNFLASQAEDFTHLEQIWGNGIEIYDQSQILEKTLLEAESYRTLLGKYEEIGINIDDETNWKILSKISILFKTCYDITKTELDELRKQKFNQNEKTSQLISQLSSILIERADIDVQRSQLQNEQAISSHETLGKNYNICLKNAVTYAQQSGGLRETSSGKLLRAKKKNEALIRLCIITNQTSVDDLNKIMGSQDIWSSELQEVLQLGIYNNFPIQVLNQ